MEDEKLAWFLKYEGLKFENNFPIEKFVLPKKKNLFLSMLYIVIGVDWDLYENNI
jgi:hypothetical protein